MAGGEMKELTIKQNMLWNSVGSITYLACQWIITVILVRFTNDYAAADVFAQATTIYSIFAPVAVYRLYTYQVSDVSKENSTGEYLSIRAITSLIAIGCCVVYAIVFSQPYVIATVIIYVVGKLVSLLIDILHGSCQLNGRMDYIGKSFILQGVSTLVVFCVVFAATADLNIALVGMAIATVLVGVLYDLPRARQFGAIRLGVSGKKIRRILVICFPSVIAAVALSAVPSIPRQFLTNMHAGDLLGIYSSVAAPVTIIQMGASYIYAPVITTFARQYAERCTKALVKTFTKVVLAIAVIGAVCAVGFVILGPLVLHVVFGPIIEPYSYLLLPMVLSTIVTAYVWFFSELLVVLRCFKSDLIGNATAVIVVLSSSYYFVGQWDMNGVSFAIAVSYGIGALVMLFYLLRVFWRMSKES